MLITDNYRIVSEDDRNLLLQKKTVNGNWRTDGYFSDFKQALKVLVKREILTTTGLSDYERVCAKIELLHKQIEELNK